MYHIGHYIQGEVRELISFETHTIEEVVREVINRYGGYFHAAVDTFFEEQDLDPEEMSEQETENARGKIRKDWAKKILANPTLTILFDGGNDQILAVGTDMNEVNGLLPAEI